MNEDALNASSYQLVVLVVEHCKVDQSDCRHVQLADHVVQLVDEVHFEFAGHDQIDAVLVREGHTSHRAVCLCHVDQFKRLRIHILVFL